MNTNSIYHFPFQVTTKDCSHREQIKLTNLLDFLQEAAWYNASRLGFSTHDLMKHGHTWVMNRMRLDFRRLPIHHEECMIETWPAAMDKYSTKRDFRIYNHQQELLLEATSNWLVMDISRRKLIQIPSYVKNADLIVERGIVNPIEGKIIYDESRTTSSKSIDVSWFDLDINNHVNNTRYIQWLMDSLAIDVLNNRELVSMDVHFRSEGKLGDKFESDSYYDDEIGSYFHQLRNIHTGQVNVFANTKFA